MTNTRPAYVLITLLTLISLPTIRSQGTIKIVASYGLIPRGFFDPIYFFASSTALGMEYLQHFVNNVMQGFDIGGKTYTIEVEILNNYHNLTLLGEHYRSFCERAQLNNNEEKVFIMGQNNDALSVRISEELDGMGCFRLAPLISLPSTWQDHDGVVPLLSAPEYYWDSVLPYIRIKGLKTIIQMCIFNHDVIGNRCTALSAQVAETGAKLVKEYTIINTSNSTLSFPNVTKTVQLAASEFPDVDVVVFTAFLAEQQEFARAMERENWGPKLVVRGEMVANTVHTPAENLQTGVVQSMLDPSFPTDDFTGKTYKEVADDIAEFNNNKPNTSVGSYLSPSISAFGFLGASLIVRTLQKQAVERFDHAFVKESLTRSVFKTNNGEFSWDITLGQKRRPYFIQIQNSSVEHLNSGSVFKIVAPVAAANADLVEFVPYNNRELDMSWGSAAEIIVLISTLAAIGLSIAFLVYIAINYRHKVIVWSSPLFLSLVGVGSIILYLSNFTWMPSLWSDATCHLSLYFLNLGFMLLFGPLFAKCLRIVLILSATKKLDRVKVPVIYLLAIIGGLMLADLILLIIYSVVNQPTGIVIYPDAFDLSVAYKSCDRSNASTPFIWLFFAEKAILVVTGMYLAYRVRKIPFKVLDESKVIAFGVYNVIFFAILGFALQYALGTSTSKTQREGLFVFRSMAVVFGGGLTVLSLFLQKIVMIKKVNSGRAGGHSPDSRRVVPMSGNGTTKSTRVGSITVNSEAPNGDSIMGFESKADDEKSTDYEEIIQLLKGEKEKWRKKAEQYKAELESLQNSDSTED